MANGFPVDILTKFLKTTAQQKSLVDTLMRDGHHKSLNNQTNSAGTAYTIASGTAMGSFIVSQMRLDSEGIMVPYLLSVIMSCSKDCEIEFKVERTALSSFGSVAKSYFRRIPLKAGTPYTLQFNDFVLLGDALSVKILSLDTSTASTFSFSPEWIECFQQPNHFAPKKILAVGDSNTKGFGTSRDFLNPYQSFMSRLWKNFYDLDPEIGLINKGIPGATAEHISDLCNSHYLVAADRDSVSVITVMLGTNLSSSLASYQAAMTNLIASLRQIYPSVPMIVLGPPPLTAGTSTANTVATYRAWLGPYVQGLSDSKIKYLNMGDAFDPADAQFGIIGAEVHPNATGHQAMFTLLKNFMATNNIKP